MRSRIGTQIALVALAAIVLAAIVNVPPSVRSATTGNYGTKVVAADADFNAQYQATPGAPSVCARDLGDTGFTTTDGYYLNMDGAGTVVAAFDVRLTAITGTSFTAGSIVGTGDSDVGATFSGTGAGLTVGCRATAATDLRFLEADGLPGWSAGDFLLWSSDTTVNAGDVRISVATSNTNQESQSVTAGTVVAGGADADAANVNDNDGLYPDCTVGPPVGAACTSAAVLQGSGSFAFRYFDANLNGALDTGDALLAAFSPAASAAPASYTINDVYLYGGSTGAGTYGTKVGRSSTDYVVEPEVFATAPLLAYGRVLGADSSCDRMWIHMRDYDGGAGRVQIDDVVIYFPTSGLTTCANPPPASSVTAGTRVTDATTHLQGTAFTATSGGTTLAALLFYVDANGNTRFDSTDPVYINKPTTFGGTAGTTVSAGDIRATAVTVGATTFTAGSIVGSTDSDINAFTGSGINNEAGKTWVVRKLNNDGANEINLQTLASVMYHDADGDGAWDPVTESVYLDVGTTANGCGGTGTTLCVNSGDFLLYDGSDLSSTTPSTTTAIACPGPTDCAHTHTTTDFKTSTDFKVTGSDTTADASRLETIYFSKDTIVNDEDFALPAPTGSGITAGQVAQPCGNACLNEGVHTSDVLYFSYCPAACPGRVLNGDVQASPSFGTRVASTVGADLVPTLTDFPVAGATLIRYNRNQATSVIDDTFYMKTDAGTALTTQTSRVTPLDSTRLAGGMVSSSSAEESSATTVADTAGGFAGRIGARDVDGIGGYSLGDFVYVNNPGGTLGGSADTILSQYDMRITGTDSNSGGYVAGTYVLAGQSDIQGGTAFTGLGGWIVGYYDVNLNGAFDEGDQAYALPPGSSALTTFPQPPLGAVRLNGPGGASGPTQSTAATTTTTPSSSSTSSSSSPTSSSPSSSPTSTSPSPSTSSSSPSSNETSPVSPSGSGSPSGPTTSPTVTPGAGVFLSLAAAGAVAYLVVRSRRSG